MNLIQYILGLKFFFILRYNFVSITDLGWMSSSSADMMVLFFLFPQAVIAAVPLAKQMECVVMVEVVDLVVT